GSSISVTWSVTNAGGLAALGSWTDRVFLSADATLDANDILLGERLHIGPLGSSDGYTETVTTELPLDASGSRFFLVKTDAANQIHELADEANNLVSAPISITLAPFADLAVSDLSAPSPVFGDPAQAAVSWTVTNAGTGAGRTADWTDAVIASVDGLAGNGDDIELAQFPHHAGLDAGSSYTQSQTILLPPSLEGRFH